MGNDLLIVAASDIDQDAVAYSIINNQVAELYFYLNPSTGQLSLAQSVFGTGTSQYVFNVQASDQRINPRYGQSTVTINVIRDQGPPSFTQDVYIGSLREDAPNGTTITRTSCFDRDLKVLFFNNYKCT